LENSLAAIFLIWYGVLFFSSLVTNSYTKRNVSFCISTREYEEFDHERVTPTAKLRENAMVSSTPPDDMEIPASSNVGKSSSMLACCRFATLLYKKELHLGIHVSVLHSKESCDFDA